MEAETLLDTVRTIGFVSLISAILLIAYSSFILIKKSEELDEDDEHDPYRRM